MYVAGDHLPTGGGGTVIVCDTGSRKCRRAVRQGTADDSAPHVDTRSLEFAADGRLLLGGDGGVYADAAPSDSGRSRWVSLNGHLGDLETYACGWDGLRHVAFCGMQDNGTAEQPAAGRRDWAEMTGADGGEVAIADGTPASNAYFSAKRLLSFGRQICVGAICTLQAPPLTIPGLGLTLPGFANLPVRVPIAADSHCPERVAIFAGGSLFESQDGAATFRMLAGPTPLDAGRVLAYSGGGCDDPARRLYAGTSTGLFVRIGAGSALTRVTAYKGAVNALAVDPANPRSVWVTKANRVTHVRLGATRAADRATVVTGDLSPGSTINAVAFVPGGFVFAGRDDGLWLTSKAHLGKWKRVAGPLPNVVVETLEFDSVDGTLLAGTVGRGAWTLAHAPGAVTARAAAAPSARGRPA